MKSSNIELKSINLFSVSDEKRKKKKKLIDVPEIMINNKFFLSINFSRIEYYVIALNHHNIQHQIHFSKNRI